MDHRAELEGLGWYRARTAFAEGVVPVRDDPPEEEDPVARALRRAVGIYPGPRTDLRAYEHATPLAVTAEDVLGMVAEGVAAGRSAARPGTPEEMADHLLRRAIPYLQSGPNRFWDPLVSEWCDFHDFRDPKDPERACKEACLHAELWRREGTSEEVWALVALRGGRPVPTRAIERAVWWRVTDQEAKLREMMERVRAAAADGGGTFEF